MRNISAKRAQNSSVKLIERNVLRSWRSCSVPSSRKTADYALPKIGFTAAPAFRFPNLKVQISRICTEIIQCYIWAMFKVDNQPKHAWQNAVVSNASMNNNPGLLPNKLLGAEKFGWMSFRTVAQLKTVEWEEIRSIKKSIENGNEKRTREKGKYGGWKERKTIEMVNDRFCVARNLFISSNICKQTQKMFSCWKCKKPLFDVTVHDSMNICNKYWGLKILAEMLGIGNKLRTRVFFAERRSVAFAYSNLKL